MNEIIKIMVLSLNTLVLVLMSSLGSYATVLIPNGLVYSFSFRLSNDLLMKDYGDNKRNFDDVEQWTTAKNFARISSMQNIETASAAGIVASITDGVAEQNQVEEQQPTTDSKVAKTKIKCSIDYRLAIKTNLLQGVASFAPNLGFEYALNNKSTIELTGALNHWGLNGSPTKNKKLAHWVIQSEYRYWLNKSFCGHFFGAHALGGKYNISGHNIPNLFLGDKLMENQHRYTGWTIGAGVSYGYHLRFAQQWGVELNIGIGVAHLRYDKYDCVRCGRKLNTETKTYFGPTKAGISLIYNL